MRISSPEISVERADPTGCNLVMGEAIVGQLNHKKGLLAQLAKTKEKDWEWVIRRGKAQLKLSIAHVRFLLHLQPTHGVDIQLQTSLRRAYPDLSLVLPS